MVAIGIWVGCSPSGVASDESLLCGGGADGWSAVPFNSVDLGPRASATTPHPEGAPVRRIIRSAQEWAETWKLIADSLPVPAVNLGDSVVIVVASERVPAGPMSIEIERVGTCRDESALVVGLRRHASERVYDYSARSIRAVSISRALVSPTMRVRYVDLPATIAR